MKLSFGPALGVRQLHVSSFASLQPWSSVHRALPTIGLGIRATVSTARLHHARRARQLKLLTQAALPGQRRIGWNSGLAEVAVVIILAVGAIVVALVLLFPTWKAVHIVDLWFRATATMVKENGDWKITHIHNSVPVAIDGIEKAELTRNHESGL